MTARVQLRGVGNGMYLGELILGAPDCGGVGDTGGDGVITVGAVGASKADALHKAALLAERIATDPVMSALLPPGTAAAVMATKKLAGAAKAGSRFVRGWFRRFKGPGVKRLAKALHHEAAESEGVGDVEGLWSGMKRAAKFAHKAAVYTQPTTWVSKAAERLAKKKKRKQAPRRPPPMRQQQQSDEDIMNTPPHEDIAPMPEDALGPMPAPDDGYDEGDE